MSSSSLFTAVALHGSAARGGVAAVWQAEGAASPRPQQMELPGEAQGHYLHLSLASGQAVQQQQQQAARVGSAWSMQQPSNPSAAAALKHIMRQQQRSFDQPGSDVSSAAATRTSAVGVPGNPCTSSNAVRVSPLFSELSAGPAASLAPGLLDSSRGDGVLPGLADVDRGLQQGLPMAAVSRVFTAAGCAVADAGPQQRVLPEQLRGNMSLRDHVRAAAAALQEQR